MADNPLRAAALEAAKTALLVHEWEPGRPMTVHRGHRYHGCCAVCASDLARMLPVALDAADKVLRETADPCPHASEVERLRAQLAVDEEATQG